MKKKLTKLDVISYCFISLLVLTSLLPMVMILIASFTDNNTILRNGYTFFPENGLPMHIIIFSHPQEK